MTRLLPFTMLCFVLVFALLRCPLHAATDQVYETTLKNGLGVAIIPLDKPGVVVGMVWYNVGSSDETVGNTGLAHALEHMMFKGTDTTKPNEYSERIAAVGGQENAFTNRDYTAYFAKINRKSLPLFLSLEADRMQHLQLTQKEFDQEIKVVREERRMRVDDNPQAMLFERLLAMAHLGNAYHQPIIGWMADLFNMTLEDAQRWYSTWYAPNNATLVLAGDLAPATVMPLIEQYFGPIPTHALPERKPQTEPAAVGPKSLTMVTEQPSQLPILIMGYMVPSLSTAKDPKDAYTLELISALLSNGKSARLQRDIVRRQQTATDVGADYDLYAKYDNLFMIYGVTRDNSSLEQLKHDFLVELTNLANHQVTEKELRRVKNNVIAKKIYSKDAVFGQAMEMGILSIIGRHWQDSEDYVDRINQITPQDIRQVAKRYFAQNRMTTAKLMNHAAHQSPPKELQ